MDMETEKHNNLEKLICWVDSAKGLGVLLVIIGHLLYSSDIPFLNRWIYSFHMPLFFFLAGFLQKKHLHDDFVFRKAKRLLVPYTLFVLAWIPIYLVSFLLKSQSLVDILTDALYLKGKVSNNPLWFLIVLMEIYAVASFLKLPEWNTEKQVAVYILVVLIGWVIWSYREYLIVLNLFGINRMILCLNFYVFGLIYKKIMPFMKEIRTKSFLLVLSGIVSISFGVLINTKVSIYNFSIGSYIPFQIAALFGTIAVTEFCKVFLNSATWISELSKYSILFLGSQYFIIIPFRHVMRKLGLAYTLYYDIAMICVVLLLVILLPRVYRLASDRFPHLRLLNGEIV